MKIPVLLFISLIASLSCKAHKSSSKVLVENGLPPSTEKEIKISAWTFKIFNPKISPGFYCTGTFVSETLLLTASHCVDPQSPGGGVIIKEPVEAAAVDLFIDPESENLRCTRGAYPEKLVELCSPVDLAVVVFKPEVMAEILKKLIERGNLAEVLPPLKSSFPTENQSVELFGWGPTGNDKDGVKFNTAYGKIARLLPGAFTLYAKSTAELKRRYKDALEQARDPSEAESQTPQKQGAAIQPGDSGGPAFDPRTGQLIGINSGLRYAKKGFNPEIESYVTDLCGKSARDVLTRAKEAHHELTLEQCR